MLWVEKCIKNKLTIYLCALALCLVGLFCMLNMTISPFPILAPNSVHITFQYPGASAGTVQTQVTSKVASKLLSVANIDEVNGSSRDGSAAIDLNLISNSPYQIMQTQIKILQAISSSHLPAAVPQPQILVSNWTSGLVNYMVYSDKMSLFDIGNFIEAKLLPKFNSLPGVTVRFNSLDPIINIGLLPNKLAEYKLSPTSIAQMIDQNFKSNPLGKLYINDKSYPLRMSDKISSLQNFGNMVVGYSHSSTQTDAYGSAIYLRDIANIALTPREPTENFFNIYNGHPAKSVSLVTTSSANPFYVLKAANDFMRSITPTLPAGLKIHIVYNTAQLMQQSFNEVAITILVASILVLFIALIFLGRLRTTLIPIIAIPICLLGAVIFVAAAGFSINIITLLAMVLAVGLVVDDSIVVVENITRHLEQGIPKKQAILQGTSDIALTIIGITATLLAVYLPIMLCSGNFITLLKSFAMPLSAAVFISGIIALTLTPVMCCSLITTGEQNSYQKIFAKMLHAIIASYHCVLKIALKYRLISLITLTALIAACAYCDLRIPRKFFPNDPNLQISIHVNAGSSDNVSTLKQKMQLFNKFYTSSRVESYTMHAEPNSDTGKLSGSLTIRYKPQYLHQLFGIADAINKFAKSKQISNTHASVDNFSSTGGGQYNLSFNVYGDQILDKIGKTVDLLASKMRQSHLFSVVDTVVSAPKMQLAFNIDAVKATHFNIYRNNISRLLSTAFGGSTLSNNFDIAGLSLPVVVRLESATLKDPDALQKLQIFNPSGKVFPLNQFASLEMVAKPTIINTFDNQPSAKINALISKHNSFANTIPYIKKIMLNDAPDLFYHFDGDALQYIQGDNQTFFIIGFGILLIYFLLAIIFKSLIDPFIILLTVPFTVVGGALSLYIMGGSINIFSTLALITLIGLITKHGVLIVQFANHELHRGASAVEAILASTRDRFRPIIMTTLAMTLGALPLVLSQQMMYVARRDLALVLISGLIIGTIFSLIIVPLVYTLIKSIGGTNEYDAHADKDPA